MRGTKLCRIQSVDSAISQHTAAASGALLGEGLAEQTGQGMFEMMLTERGRRAVHNASSRPLHRLLSQRRATPA